MKYDISVIMLVYNTPKKLLEKSVQSVLNQTQKNIELIFVDDCSTNEETIECLKSFCDKYDFIKTVRHKKIYGLLRGRLTGFSYSNGEYIAYLDSDDAMSRDYLRTLLKTAKEKKADLVVSSFLLDESGIKKMNPRCPFVNKNFDLYDDEIFDVFMKQEGAYYGWSLVWNKLYKRSLIEKFFDELMAFCEKHVGLNMHEDIAFSTFSYKNAKHLVSVNEEYVYYMFHAGASTQNNTKQEWLKNLNDVATVVGFIKNTLKKNNLYDKYESNFVAFKDRYVNIYNRNKPEKVGKIEALSTLSKLLNDGKPVEIDENFEEYYYEDYLDVTWHENEKDQIIQNICDEKHKAISFEVFDTLLLRNLFEPKDLFKFLSIEFNKISGSSYIKFEELRVFAEEKSRQVVKSEEVTLDDIYSYIENHYKISHDLCEKMKQKELELELKFIRRRDFGHKLCEIAKEQNKQVVFISDSYLSTEFVKKLLDKCGYSDYKVFVSSDIGLTKHTSHLFTHVLKTLNLKPQEMFHIGDNYHSDFEMARSVGMDAYRIFNVHEMFVNNIYQKLLVENQTFLRAESFWEKLLVKSMFGLVKNKFFDNPLVCYDQNTVFNGMAKNLGYFGVGMELVALNDWLKNNSQKTDCIHFVARDGYLPKLSYDIFKSYNKSLPNSNYFYMSRKALLPLDISSQKDLNSIPVKIDVRTMSLNDLLSYFDKDCVNYDYVQEVCKKNKINPDKKFESEDCEEFYEAVSVLDDKCINYQKHNKHINEIVGLLKEKVTPNSKFFDIGYSGSAESILSKKFGYPVNSLYMHTNWDTAEIRSQLSGFNISCFFGGCPKVTGTIREHIFMKFAPSLIAFKAENGELKYVFEKEKVDYTSKLTTEIVQESALEFVKDFYENFYDYLPWLSFQRDLIVFPYEKYLNYPTLRDKRIFSCVMFEDDLGAGRKKLIDVWVDWGVQAQDDYSQQQYAHATRILNFINKWFPKGTRRRKFAVKVYYFLTRKKNKKQKNK